MRIVPWIVAIAFTAAVSAAPAGEFRDGESTCGGRTKCPRCHVPCEMSVAKEKEEKSCWDVECKTICIPRITFPWQACHSCKGAGACDGRCDGGPCMQKNHHGDLCRDVVCAPPVKCGRTKTVRVLTKHTYECSVCKYKWEPSGGKHSPLASH